MAGNTNLTADLVIKEAAAQFNLETPFLAGCSRSYDNSYEAYGAKSGQTIRLKRPDEFVTGTGKTITTTGQVERSIDFTRSTQDWVAMSFSAAELAQDIKDIRPKIKGAMRSLAKKVEYQAMALAYKGVGNLVGTAGTNPNSWEIIAKAGAKLDNFDAPQGERSCVLNPLGQVALANSSVAYFNPQDNLRSQWITGRMGQAAGFSFASTNNVPRHTVGAIGDNTALVNDTFASGDSTISMDDFSNATPSVTAGDVFTIANVYAVDPLTKQSTGELYQFVVATAKTGSGNAITDIELKEAVYSSGVLQNVDALPANDAAVTFVGAASTSYAQNLAWAKPAFVFGTVDLPLHGATDFEARDNVNGVSMRIMKVSDGVNDDLLYRVDVLWGFAVYEPRWACRIVGA